MVEKCARNFFSRFARNASGPSFIALCLFLLPAVASRADQVEMQNGDRYFGKVLSLTNDTLVLQSELLGKVSVPCSKVSSIKLGTNFVARTPQVQPEQPATTAQPLGNILSGRGTTPGLNSLPDLRELNKPGATATAAQQVRQQLTSAGPAAIGRFDQMVSGLASGKLSVNDIRAQAKSVSDQVRAFKRDLGDDAASDVLDGYLEILDSFLRDSASAGPIPNPGVKGPKAPASDPSGE